MGCFVYALLGSCKDITIGPTALMALMTYQQVIGRNADFAVLLAFLTGCVQLLMALLQLGIVRCVCVCSTALLFLDLEIFLNEIIFL